MTRRGPRLRALTPKTATCQTDASCHDHNIRALRATWKSALSQALARPMLLTLVGSALLMASAVVASGCALPTDETAQAIDPDDLPETLRPGFVAVTTTVVPAPQTELQMVYLLTNPQDTERTVVAGVTRQLNSGADLADVLSTLFGSSTLIQEQAAGYFNTLELFELTSVTVEDGVATVDIVPLSPQDLPPPANTLELVAAQLVFTASAFDGVKGVRILLDGEAVSVPTSGADAEPGLVLTTDAYEQYQPDLAATVPSTTTTLTDSAPAVLSP